MRDMSKTWAVTACFLACTAAVARADEPLGVHTVQGAAHLSPYQGQVVTVGPAIVTVLRSNGFYMQDVTPDADDATSEGIFVFTSAAPTVSVAARVTVQGTVTEFRPGCTPSCAASTSAFDNLTTTQLSDPTVSVIDADNALPPPVVLEQRRAPLQVICDDAAGSVESSGVFDPASDGIDFYESLEGMRVQLDQPEVIDPTRTFDGATPALEIGVLASADAGLRSARGGISIAQGDFNPERVFLSNALVSSFPSVNVGDRFDGAVVGVIDYSFANYKLIVTEALPSVIAGGLSQETTPLGAELEHQLSIASMNVENLDALDAPAKLSELAKIVVERLRSPDLIALEEVQDNNGATNDGVVDASTTLSTFADAIASAGGPSYEYRQIDPVNNADGGEPGGNIRVAFLFRTDRGLAFVDRGSATPTTANRVELSGEVPQLAFSPGRIDPENSAWASSRKPLAGEFTFRGRTLFVIANHFNSKGGDDPLFGRQQPPVLASETQRVRQAAVLAGFVEAILTADSEALVVALGDFNDFSFSAPLVALQNVGLVDLINTLPANERYTYLYQGNSQDLDHILVSPALAALASYDIVHVNAEFATQASDHDPAVMRIELVEAPEPEPGSSWLQWWTRLACAFFPRWCARG
jgi:predicted extracellular nuclease